VIRLFDFQVFCFSKLPGNNISFDTYRPEFTRRGGPGFDEDIPSLAFRGSLPNAVPATSTSRQIKRITCPAIQDYLTALQNRLSREMKKAPQLQCFYQCSL